MPLQRAPVGPARRIPPAGNFGTQPVQQGGPGMGRATMPSYKKGGVVKKTGPALVHKGERITPVKKAKKK